MKVKNFVAVFAFLLFQFTLFSQVEITSEELNAHVTYLASDELRGRGPGNAEMSVVRDYIVGQFEAAGLQPFGDDFREYFSYRMASLNVEGVNIAGIIEGSDPVLKDEYIVLGAHYDHLGWEMEDNDSIIIYNGADDNASGVATIIEIAEYLKHRQDDLRRSVVFVAFDAEELGLKGSKRFVERHIDDTSRILTMFSLDMVGMYEANKGVELNGIQLIEGIDDILPGLIDEHAIEISDQNADFSNRTDSKPFLDMGIPAVHVFTDTESPYHKPEDDAHLLDYDGMAIIGQFIAGLTIELANSDKITPLKGQDKPMAMKRKIFEAGVIANLGSSHIDFTNEYFKAKPIFAGGAGLFAQIRFSESFSVQPEVHYLTYGSQFAPDNIRFHAVHAPLNLKFKVGEGGNGAYAAIGGFYTHHFYGTLGNNDLDFPEEFMEYDAGLTYGFGLEIIKFQVGFRSNLGFVDLNDEGESNLQSRSSYLVIGYTF